MNNSRNYDARTAEWVKFRIIGCPLCRSWKRNDIYEFGGAESLLNWTQHCNLLQCTEIFQKYYDALHCSALCMHIEIQFTVCTTLQWVNTLLLFTIYYYYYYYYYYLPHIVMCKHIYTTYFTTLHNCTAMSL